MLARSPGEGASLLLAKLLEKWKRLRALLSEIRMPILLEGWGKTGLKVQRGGCVRADMPQKARRATKLSPTEKQRRHLYRGRVE